MKLFFKQPDRPLPLSPTNENWEKAALLIFARRHTRQIQGRIVTCSFFLGAVHQRVCLSHPQLCEKSPHPKATYFRSVPETHFYVRYTSCRYSGGGGQNSASFLGCTPVRTRKPLLLARKLRSRLVSVR